MPASGRWDWLSSRLSPRAIWDSSGTPAPRPCLPALEPLDDRILLSDATTSGVIKQGSGDVAVLIALLNAQFALTKNQLTVLGLASKANEGDDTQLLNKLAGELLDVNEQLAKFSDALIKGELSQHKQEQFLQKFNEELADVQKFVLDFDAGGQKLLLPAVQQMSSLAVDAFLALNKLGAVNEELGHKDEHSLVKIGDQFLKLDDLALKIAVDVLTGGFIKGEQEMVKFERLVNKASDYLFKIEDPAVQKLLLPAVEALSFSWGALIGALIPGDNPNQGPFEGGVTIEDQTDDLISGS